MFLELYISENTDPIKVLFYRFKLLAIYDIRTNKICYFKAIIKSIMPAQKHKKNMAEIFCIFECLLPQNPQLKALNSLHSSRPYGRLLEHPKTRVCRELFLHENDFKTCSAVNFPKKHSDFGGLETNQRYEIQN